VRIAIEELRHFYESAAPLPPLAIAFDDYLALVEQRTLSERRQRDRAYWMERLDRIAGAPGLPPLQPPASIAHARFGSRAWTIPAGEWAMLQGRARAEGVTVSALLGGAFAETMAAFSARQDFCLNLPAFDRRPLHADVERIIGPFSTNVI